MPFFKCKHLRSPFTLQAPHAQRPTATRHLHRCLQTAWSPNVQCRWTTALNRGQNSTKRPPEREKKNRAKLGREKEKQSEILGGPGEASRSGELSSRGGGFGGGRRVRRRGVGGGGGGGLGEAASFRPKGLFFGICKFKFYAKTEFLKCHVFLCDLEN